MNFFFWLIYDVAIAGYGLLIQLFALTNPKAGAWVKGRKNWRHHLKELLKSDEQRVWFHCASAGEFEQARPLIEAYRQKFPQQKIVLTFFSPSGFELRKNYNGADHIFYLPLDTKRNARDFISLINPSLVVFVKYEFWLHILNELKRKNISVVLISAIFRKNQLILSPPLRNMLKTFSLIFVQNKESLLLLEQNKTENGILSADTRFDRVIQISKHPQQLPPIEKFKGQGKLLVAGSTWPDDEKLLIHLLNELPVDWKMILVPHEISASHISQLSSALKKYFVFYDEVNESRLIASRVLIMNKIGLLSSLYAYANMAYVGGGFGRGIHNILEAAVFGIPVLFGPNYSKFNEANELLEWGSVRSTKNVTALVDAFEYFSGKQQDAIINKNYVEKNAGATAHIMQQLIKLNTAALRV